MHSVFKVYNICLPACHNETTMNEYTDKLTDKFYFECWL